MPTKRHTSEQIVHLLREAEVELAKGSSVKEVAKKLGITDQTYYRWRKEYGWPADRPSEASQEARAREWPLEEPTGGVPFGYRILREAARGN